MSGFLLSPGITPLITDLAVLALPLGLALGYLLHPPRGFELGLAAVTLALGLVKLATDPFDLLDLPVALGGILIGGSLLAHAVDHPVLAWMPGPLWRSFGVLAVAVGAFKIATDPYDPFDVELAALVLGLGGLFASARGSFGKFRPWRVAT